MYTYMYTGDHHTVGVRQPPRMQGGRRLASRSCADAREHLYTHTHTQSYAYT